VVSQALVRSKTNLGYAKAASALGAPCQWYRPNGPTAPIVSGNLLGSLTCLFDTTPAMTQQRPSQFGKPDSWYGAFDATSVQVGDYLVDATYGTFFVASLELFRTAKMVLCNEVLTFGRPGSPIPGAKYYGGATGATLSQLLASWPAAVIQGVKGESGELKLPGDVRLPWAIVMLPNSVGVQLLTADEANTDEASPRWLTLSSVEATPLGYRLTASLATS
jgi:hypothetical protein